MKKLSCIMAVLMAMIFTTAIYATDIRPGSFGGRLSSESSHDMGGKAYSEYSLDLQAGETVFILAESEEIDSYLTLTQADGTTIENDDFDGMGTDAALFHTAREGGTVRIQVSSFSSADYGEYTLRVVALQTTDLSSNSEQGIFQDAGDSPLFAAYRYVAPEDAQVSIDLMSPDFDTYLYIILPNGLMIKNDDAEWGNTNSRLTVPVSAADELVIIAGSYSNYATGSFEIRTELLDPIAVSDSTDMELGLELIGYLFPGQEEFEGKPAIMYNLELSSGQAIQIDLMSDDFDAYLTVTGPNYFYASDDDSGQGRNARLIMTAPESGRYQIYAASFHRADSGYFTLLTTEGQAPLHSADAMIWTGILSNRSPIDTNGNLYSEHSIQLEAGETITITAESEDFDTVLILMDASGRIVAENDDYHGTNSMLQHQADRGGLFTTRVRSFGSAGDGRYTVTAEIFN